MQNVEVNKTETSVNFKDKLVPSPKLLEGENELMSIKAGLMEVGPVGFIIRQKEKIVLTQKRVFQYSSRLGSASLRTMYMSEVQTVTVGGKINMYMIIGAIAALLLVFSEDTPPFFRFVLLIVAAVLFVISRSKVISVSAGESKEAITLPLKSIKKEESQKIVDLVSKYKLNS